uniref:Large ribosomal subunit protein mL67 n=1 Tax=Blastobotrys adeninivorans TaxID=409370 RepID=A0A060SXI6_BLAAD
MPGFTQRAGKYRRPNWLRNRRYGPNVFVFRNLETNQVLYTQTPFPQRYNIAKQFQGPNWQNRLPTTRNDLWRAMAVAQLPNYESAVHLYERLVQLRHMRDYTHRDVAMAMRKKNEDGNIWFYSQFRPTYTQEAVSDLISALEHLDVSAKIHWEDSWRRGDESHWEDIEVEHAEFPRYNPRERHVVLRKIADQSYKTYMSDKANFVNKALRDLAAQVRARAEARGKFETFVEHPGGPSQKWPEHQLQEGIKLREQKVSEYMKRAYAANQDLRTLPQFGNVRLRRKLRNEARHSFAVLRRVQRALEKYRRAERLRRRFTQAKAKAL